jgi:hypothetical protein
MPKFCPPAWYRTQRDQRPRPIIDYTFSEVNEAAASQALDTIKFGAALLRYLQRLERSDTRRGTIKLTKTDISDTIMRIWISLPTIPCLGAVLPTYCGFLGLAGWRVVLS